MKRTQFKNAQSGFTLIELVIVIVILGILAATAIPKFIDLRSDATAAAAQGYAGALNSASAINKSGCAVKAGVATTGVCVAEDSATAKCADIGALVAPAITFTTAAALPSPTVQGTLYITTANNVALTTAGATCNFTLGDGGTGVNATFVGYATK